MERLTDREFNIMMIFWECPNDEISVGHILRRLECFERDSVRRTRDILKRLERKGFLEYDSTKLETVYRCVISRDTYVDLSEGPCSRFLYNSFVKNYIMSLLGDDKITPKDIKQLEEYLEKRRKALSQNNDLGQKENKR